MNSSTFYLVNFHFHTQGIFIFICLLIDRSANRHKYIVKFWTAGAPIVINKIQV